MRTPASKCCRARPRRGSAKPGPAQDHHRDALSLTRARRVSHFHQNATTAQLCTTRSRRSRKWLRDGAMVAPLPMETSAAQPSKTPLRYANPIHAASKSDTPRVSGDQSGARESQSTAGADTKEPLNTCNRRLSTRALPTVPHPASTVAGARALSTPSDSWPPPSTKRYAVAAVPEGPTPHESAAAVLAMLASLGLIATDTIAASGRDDARRIGPPAHRVNG